MSTARSLHRRIDDDLVDAVLIGGIKKPPPLISKARKHPRPAASYRAARRNEARATHTLDVMKRFRPEAKYLGAPAAYLNRSENWPRAMTYSYAREIGPSADPVR